MVKLRPCGACGHMGSPAAAKCPMCGQPSAASAVTQLGCALTVLVFVVLPLIVVSYGCVAAVD